MYRLFVFRFTNGYTQVTLDPVNLGLQIVYRLYVFNTQTLVWVTSGVHDKAYFYISHMKTNMLYGSVYVPSFRFPIYKWIYKKPKNENNDRFSFIPFLFNCTENKNWFLLCISFNLSEIKNRKTNCHSVFQT